MQILHKAEERGAANLDWLKTRYSFSFANWFNPEKMGFGALRVINDDLIAPHSGFPMHGHKDMEIITIVKSGRITHSDNMGNKDISISKGEIQVMSAGTGVLHAEMNDEDVPLSLFQIWIEPNTKNVAPRYDQKKIPTQENAITQLIGSMESGAPLKIHQDAFISSFSGNKEISYKKEKPDHGVYVFAIKGKARVNGTALSGKDALGILGEEIIVMPEDYVEILFFEVPM
ncbi:MAG: pirin family protein [Patescibacteria group bacterium UBA2103]